MVLKGTTTVNLLLRFRTRHFCSIYCIIVFVHEVYLDAIIFKQIFQVISKQRMTELVREIDPNEQLDEEVEEMLFSIADDFIESTVNAACRLAKHRNARSLDVRDVQTYLGKF